MHVLDIYDISHFETCRQMAKTATKHFKIGATVACDVHVEFIKSITFILKDAFASRRIE